MAYLKLPAEQNGSKLEKTPPALPKRRDAPYYTKGDSDAARIKRQSMWTADQITTQLRQYDRAPFLDLLSVWMECAPTPEDIIALADKYPDRYVAALHSLGKLSGFTEKREIDVDVHVHVRGMSDSQLEDRLSQLSKALKLPLALPVIEAEAVVVEDERNEDAGT